MVQKIRIVEQTTGSIANNRIRCCASMRLRAKRTDQHWRPIHRVENLDSLEGELGVVRGANCRGGVLWPVRHFSRA
jgi:hypothetical protein